MKKLALTTVMGVVCLVLGACGKTETADTNMAVDADDMTVAGEATGAEAMANGSGTMGTTATGTASSSAFPRGARIVDENGVTYRIGANGDRVRLGANDSRIVVDNGVRYRVDTDGSRVRIDPRGASIDVDLPDLTPDVDLGVNNKGNLDIDVKNKKDGNEGPN